MLGPRESESTRGEKESGASNQPFTPHTHTAPPHPPAQSQSSRQIVHLPTVGGGRRCGEMRRCPPSLRSVASLLRGLTSTCAGRPLCVSHCGGTACFRVTVHLCVCRGVGNCVCTYEILCRWPCLGVRAVWVCVSVETHRYYLVYLLECKYAHGCLG